MAGAWDATFSISETLHILGSSLGSVILEPSFSSPDHDPDEAAQLERPTKLELPDLSYNKQLRWVRLLNVAKDDCPEGYVSDVVSTIYPKNLEHLQIEFRSGHSTGPWQDIGFVQLANLLASEHRASWKRGVYLYVGVDPGTKHADAVAQIAALEATIKSRHADSLGQYLHWTPMVSRKSVY
ncbi:hypothetical protein BC629DRAFT_1592144 [Irpex lacteus]|nr:hypothetical protein BC629DRAFT_1592144 [Irpex lacteus]